ncbi:hypothetical protein MHK_005569, partial [Candidatus Magnetomorum sp. HK-1]
MVFCNIFIAYTMQRSKDNSNIAVNTRDYKIQLSFAVIVCFYSNLWVFLNALIKYLLINIEVFMNLSNPILNLLRKESFMIKKLFTMIFFSLLIINLHSGCNSQDSFAEPVTDEPAAEAELTGLPVDIDSLVEMDYEIYGLSISNADLHNVTDGDTDGLTLDLNNADLWGKVYTGPY